MKPDEWDEDAPRMILDESAVKPEGWLDDEPDMIPDPEVETILKLIKWAVSVTSSDPSVQSRQCPIHNGTFNIFCLIKYVLDINVIILDMGVL